MANYEEEDVVGEGGDVHVEGGGKCFWRLISFRNRGSHVKIMGRLG